MTSTETPAKDQSLEPPGKIPRYKDAGQIVHSRISRLQKQLFSSGHEAQARASLAALRQAVSQSPGESFEIWELTTWRRHLTGPQMHLLQRRWLFIQP